MFLPILRRLPFLEWIQNDSGNLVKKIAQEKLRFEHNLGHSANSDVLTVWFQPYASEFFWVYFGLVGLIWFQWIILSHDDHGCGLGEWWWRGEWNGSVIWNPSLWKSSSNLLLHSIVLLPLAILVSFSKAIALQGSISGFYRYIALLLLLGRSSSSWFFKI